MIPRWVIALPRSEGLPYYYGGRHAWTGKLDKAVKFAGKDQAESHALVIVTEEPYVLGEITVLSYSEALERENQNVGPDTRPCTEQGPRPGG